jgi:tellurite resistance protein TerC
LAVIVGVLVITTVASLLSTRGRAQNAVAGARRHATEYLDLNYCADQAEREKIFARLLDEEKQIKALAPKHRARIRREEELMDLLRAAHAAHRELDANHLQTQMD